MKLSNTATSNLYGGSGHNPHRSTTPHHLSQSLNFSTTKLHKTKPLKISTSQTQTTTTPISHNDNQNQKPKPWPFNIRLPTTNEILLFFLVRVLDPLHHFLAGDKFRIRKFIIYLRDENNNTLRDKFVSLLKEHKARIYTVERALRLMSLTRMVRRNFIQYSTGPPSDKPFRNMLKDCAELLLENEDRWVISWSTVHSRISEVHHPDEMQGFTEGDIPGVKIFIEVDSNGVIDDKSIHTREDVKMFLQHLSSTEAKISNASVECFSFTMAREKLNQDYSHYPS